MKSEPNDDAREIEDLLVDWECARQAGEELSVARLCEDRPDLLGAVSQRIAVLKQLSWVDEPQQTNEVMPSSEREQHSIIGAVDETQIPDSDVTVAEFLNTLTNSGVLTKRELETLRLAAPDNHQQRAFNLAHQLVGQNLITPYQAKVILERGDSPLLLDRYVILDSIGGGGMGIVFKALQRSLERVVAVKVLPKHAVDSPDKIERFQREMRAAAKLSHPNVVQAFDAYESNGIYFFAMEYVPGCDLSQLVDAHGNLPVEQALDIVSQAAAGLANAHQNNIIHRDVKPGNILLSDTGVAKVLDLGLARVREIASPTTSLTRDGLTMGTVTYMSPEQAFDAKQADERSDIYSLGCTLYFLLHGRPVFDEPNSVQTVIAHRESPTPQLTDGRNDVSQGLEQLFQRMLAKNPDERPPSMLVVQRELEKLMQPFGEAERAATLATKPQPGVFVADLASDATVAQTTAKSANGEHSPQTVKRGAIAKWLGLLGAVAIVASLVFFAVGRPGSQPATAETLATQLISDEVSLFVRTDSEEFQADYVEELPDAPFTISGAVLYPTGDVDLEPLREIPNIEALHIVCPSEDVLPLGQLPGKDRLRELEELSCDGFRISRNALVWMTQLPKLRYLDLTRCELPNEWQTLIANAQLLTDLTLLETETTDEDLAELAKLNQLTFLDLSNTRVTSDGLQNIAALPIAELGLTGLKLNTSLRTLKEFSQLRRLYVDGTNLTDEMAEQIANVSDLRLLHAGHTELSSAGVRTLAQIPSLRELGLQGLQISAAINDIVKMPRLRNLLLDNTDLGDEELSKLSQLKRLKLLQVPETQVTDTAVERFRLRVPSCVVLTKSLEEQIIELQQEH